MKVVRVRTAGRSVAAGEIFLGSVQNQHVLGEETTDQHRVLEVTEREAAQAPSFRAGIAASTSPGSSAVRRTGE